VKALANNAGGGWDGHAQLILYWLTQERHISYAVAAAQTLDVSEPKSVLGFPILRPMNFFLPYFFLFVQRGTIPTLFLTVRGLPKDALIEKQVLYHTGQGCAVDEDGDLAPLSCSPIYGTGIGLSSPPI
jgi:diphthine-ammonia ligase